MKSNLKLFFIITTITSYLKITSKIQVKGPFGKFQRKITSNSIRAISYVQPEI